MAYILVIILLACSGLFSGLTLGFFSLNSTELKRKASLGNKRAEKIYAVRKDGNLLLTTLLLGNVGVNSILAVFLGSITSGLVAGLVSTALIVVFGEIIPQATFARHALNLGAIFARPVRWLMVLLWPITAPVAYILNQLLGDEVPQVYSKHEMIKIVEDHEHSHLSSIDTDERKIVAGALEFSEKLVKEAMTPRDAIVALPADAHLDDRLRDKIHASGKSRIPVYTCPNGVHEHDGQRGCLDSIVGMLFVKDLVEKETRNKQIGEVARKTVYFVDENELLDNVLTAFKRTRNHLFVVRSGQKTVGVITIEDVLEEIIGGEIRDEYDVNE